MRLIIILAVIGMVSANIAVAETAETDPPDVRILGVAIDYFGMSNGVRLAYDLVGVPYAESPNAMFRLSCRGGYCTLYSRDLARNVAAALCNPDQCDALPVWSGTLEK